MDCNDTSGISTRKHHGVCRVNYIESFSREKFDRGPFESMPKEIEQADRYALVDRSETRELVVFEPVSQRAREKCHGVIGERTSLRGELDVSLRRTEPKFSC